MTFAAPTLSAICPWTLAPDGGSRGQPRTPSAEQDDLPKHAGTPSLGRRRRLLQTSTHKPATCHGRTPCLDFAGYSPQRQRLVGVGRCVRSPEPGRMRSGKS
jgi:hypothetical protein